ncbi:NAD(P)-dependent oxidoreductase [Aliifodinibius salipaludis]|uniref:NAD(P)-dependent oxidoreductase n=1 Tax=Fodinibius salipaludis TaxID=2032627 RepID=A0A2A2GCC7_9BACT|nr:SDR family oxidoreductase [Aliifodinibius salipaludis]PAU94519.1 NAD(P)-dependent oxidoreductase [Aliifodinibius salipaludis]
MTISILGCGWLGLPLAERLRDEGHQIKGSTTSEDKLQVLKGKNITPFLLKLTPKLQCNDCDHFWDADVLVLNIPPGRSKDNVKEFHQQQIQAVIDRLKHSPIEFVVFISSTSVYPKKGGIVSEEDTKKGKASRASGNALLEAEKMLRKESEFKTTVIRFGGLYGHDRHPVKYMSGRKDISNGNAPVNLIHQKDCINIIQKVIEDDITDQTFNGVSDGHPPKKMYYPAVAKAMDLEPPTFEDDESKKYKVVSNRKLKMMLNYKFSHPNPMDF